MCSNGLVEYFVDPYSTCPLTDACRDEKTRMHVMAMELLHKRMVALHDKHPMNRFAIANEKYKIDEYFERKHAKCHHVKRSGWTKLKLQFKHLT